MRAAHTLFSGKPLTYILFVPEQSQNHYFLKHYLFSLFQTNQYGSPPAIERLSGGLLQEVIVTNTLPVAEKNYFPQLTILSVANLLGETIWRVHDDSSVSSIFL